MVDPKSCLSDPDEVSNGFSIDPPCQGGVISVDDHSQSTATSQQSSVTSRAETEDDESLTSFVSGALHSIYDTAKRVATGQPAPTKHGSSNGESKQQKPPPQSSRPSKSTNKRSNSNGKVRLSDRENSGHETDRTSNSRRDRENKRMHRRGGCPPPSSARRTPQPKTQSKQTCRDDKSVISASYSMSSSVSSVVTETSRAFARSIASKIDRLRSGRSSQQRRSRLSSRTGRSRQRTTYFPWQTASIFILGMIMMTKLGFIELNLQRNEKQYLRSSHDRIPEQTDSNTKETANDSQEAKDEQNESVVQDEVISREEIDELAEDGVIDRKGQIKGIDTDNESAVAPSDKYFKQALDELVKQLDANKEVKDTNAVTSEETEKHTTQLSGGYQLPPLDPKYGLPIAQHYPALPVQQTAQAFVQQPGLRGSYPALPNQQLSPFQGFPQQIPQPLYFQQQPAMYGQQPNQSDRIGYFSDGGSKVEIAAPSSSLTVTKVDSEELEGNTGHSPEDEEKGLQESQPDAILDRYHPSAGSGSAVGKAISESESST